MKNKYTLPKGFTVTAHTGCMGTKENSTASLFAGKDSGADIVEFDLNFTPDGKAFMSHNAPDGSEEPAEKAFEFLSQNKDMRINIDVKATLNLSIVPQYADKFGVREQIFFTGVGESFVPAVKEQCPGIAYYLNYKIDTGKKNDSEYINTIIKKVKDCGAVGINFNKSGISPELINGFRSAGLLTSVWTLKSKREMRRVLKLAPDNITTKNTKKLLRIINT